MRILAIDPGPVNSAWCVYDTLASRPIEKCDIQSNEEVARLIPPLLAAPNCPDAFACEMIASYGMAVGKEVFETVYWIGRFCQAWGHDHHRVYRKEVTMHLCNSVKGSDASVRAALIDLLGPPRSKELVVGKNGKAAYKSIPGPTAGVSKDMWAALGVAVTMAAKLEAGR